MGAFTDKPQGEVSFAAILEAMNIKFGDFEAVQFCDDGEGEVVRKHVYKLTADDRACVLKKSSCAEVDVYRKFLSGKGFSVPEFYGCAEVDGEIWILIEHIDGCDLRDFTLEMAQGCAESIAAIMNAYWQEDRFDEKRLDDRFDRYWQRINRRAESLSCEPELAKAYQVFLDRQLKIPRTLCNGDFLQYNGILREGGVVVIDWAFGGVMPYALDIARLIAHGTDGKQLGFPFYMTDALCESYVRGLYERLENKPDWQQYLCDIRLAVLNEYIEFLECYFVDPAEEKDDFFHWYYGKACALAEQINVEQFS